jgi:serine/threonine protein kinase/tetratricopeptide (TPR) repeat protein
MNAPSQSDIFEHAVALPPPERNAWVDKACAGDAPLRQQIDSLLHAHDAANSFMETTAPDLKPVKPWGEVVAEEKPGDRIGRYKLLQKIGEGGCGVVYMAEQEESVQRRVALKVIKLGMDTKTVIARFAAERQALARMEHPNIARVLDAGATNSGRPFFVMELVRGLKITDYCDQSNLSTEQRLELFIKVCQAIQHAHQKGVIHRDIKPSNILVTLHDGQPVPKVIDFGIAKATHGRLTDATLFTAFEQFIGTPAYVSPEQAEMSGLDIDTRSDIYSLGVLLYELLMGRTPFDTSELMRAGIDEMRRRIREQEPPRPSHRLRTLNDSDRTTVARRRGTDAPRLSLQLRGDLDWIVMRCLEKDRARRYETANGLATDIQRHLRNEPVSARPPSTPYLIQKLIRRHRRAFVAGAAVAAALVAGFTVSTLLYLSERAMHGRAREAEAKAMVEKARAEVATANEARLRVEAEAEKRRAQTEAERGARLATLMSVTMKQIGLLISLGNDRLDFRSVLDQATNLKLELANQPELEADVDETLGGAYFKMGDFKRAEELLMDALKLRRRAQGENAPSVAETLKYLGLVYIGQGRWFEAETCHRDALALLQRMSSPPPAEVAKTLSTLGWVLAQQAKFTEAENCLNQALERQRKSAATSGVEIASTLTRLGSVHMQEGRVPQAEKFLREALVINRQVFGHGSVQAASSLNVLAVTVALDQRRLPEAIALYREAFEIRERNSDPDSATAVAPVIGATPDIGEDARREARSAPSLRPVESMLLPRESMAEVGNALREAQRFPHAQYAKESWEEAFNLALTAWVLLQEGKFVEAETPARQCLAIRSKLSPDDWSVYHAQHMLGGAKAGLKDYREAEPLLVDGYNGMKARRATMPGFHIPRIGESALRIIRFYQDMNRLDDAAKWQTEFNNLDAEAKRSLIVGLRSPSASAKRSSVTASTATKRLGR